jgi:hypothetical protein
MSHTQKSWRPSHTRCARRSLVELTAAASRAVDDGLFVSSGIASNPQSERTGEKTSDQTILARQATARTPALLESRYAAVPRKDDLLDSDSTTEIMVKIAKVYQNRAFENIKASLNAALDPAKDLVETRVGGGEVPSRDVGGSSLESNVSTVLKEAATELRADAVELVVQTPRALIHQSSSGLPISPTPDARRAPARHPGTDVRDIFQAAFGVILLRRRWLSN